MDVDYSPLVMLVDDDESILNSLHEVLGTEGYQLITASSGTEALEKLDSQGRIVSVVVADLLMSAMNGVSLLAKVRERSRETTRVLISDYADAQVVQDAINQGQVYRFVGKPWEDDDLRAVVRSAVRRSETMRNVRSLVGQLAALEEDLESVSPCPVSLRPEATEEQEREDLFAESGKTVTSPVWQEIVEAMPLAVLGVDKESTIVLANPHVERVLGINRWSLLGLRVTEALPERLAEAILHMTTLKRERESCSVVALGKALAIDAVPLSPSHEGNRRGALLFIRSHPGDQP